MISQPAGSTPTTGWSLPDERLAVVLPTNSPYLSTTSTYSEADLVALLRTKSQSAFSYLYKAYGPVLFGVVKRVVVDEGIAEDVLQEVFVKIWANIGQYDAGKGRIYTWMINIARNTAIDKLRSKGEIMRGKIRGDEDAVDNQRAELRTEQSTDTIGVKQAVAGLEPKYAEIVQLAYFQGYTLDEISKTLVVPLGTVKTRMRQAMHQLRQYFSR